MLFSSKIFLFLFLPLTVLGYYLINRKLRNVFLLLSSLVFYAWGEPKFVIIMIGSILINFFSALTINHFRASKFISKMFLSFNIFINLIILFIFKYLDFFFINLNKLGFGLVLQNIALPIGISFFTFQAMSYVIDVYRGDVQVQKKIHYLGLYITFFPQLVAGPIVRYKDVERQITDRKETFELFSEGIFRFIIGFNKKILLSNNMAIVADIAFNTPHDERSILLAWLGAVAYSFQILFDFSGYSDMAIGLGKMFGFEFLENFDLPYTSKSISEFWRRWHMSLGQWFRDYVYFPLGGSRVNKKRLIFNLFIVWFLTGIWHGASWNFIAWGLLYFVFITIEKLLNIPNRFHQENKKFCIIVYQMFTMFTVISGWVLFRSNGLNNALLYLKTMVIRNKAALSTMPIFLLKENLVFLIASTFISLGFFRKIRNMFEKNNNVTTFMYDIMLHLVLCVLFIWSVSYLVLGSHNPFIYFNF